MLSSASFYEAVFFPGAIKCVGGFSEAPSVSLPRQRPESSQAVLGSFRGFPVPHFLIFVDVLYEVAPGMVGTASSVTRAWSSSAAGLRGNSDRVIFNAAFTVQNYLEKEWRARHGHSNDF